MGPVVYFKWMGLDDFMVKAGFVVFLSLFANEIILGTSPGSDESDLTERRKVEAYLVIEYVHSVQIESKNQHSSYCLKSRRRELGETWCVNCHAGVDPDRMQKL